MSLRNKAEDWIWNKIPEKYKTPFSVCVVILVFISIFFTLYKLNSNNKEVKKYAPQTMVNSPGGFLIQGDIKIGAQARILSDKDKNDLIKNLDKSKKILVSTIDSDSEAFKFATQILQFLKNQGYSATGIDRVSYTSSFVGVKVEAKETGDYEVRVGSL